MTGRSAALASIAVSAALAWPGAAAASFGAGDFVFITDDGVGVRPAEVVWNGIGTTQPPYVWGTGFESFGRVIEDTQGRVLVAVPSAGTVVDVTGYGVLLHDTNARQIIRIPKAWPGTLEARDYASTGDDLIGFDPATGLEWLHLSVSVGEPL